MSTSPSILIRNNAKRPRGPVLAPLRAVGKPRGTYIMDLAGRRESIILCDACNHQFDHARAHYYKDRRFSPLTGICDACREHSQTAQFYIHESYLADPGGRVRSGQTWLPK